MRKRKSEETRDKLGLGYFHNGHIFPRFEDRDIPSSGVTSRFVNPKTGTMITCISQGERNQALLLIWDDDVTEIYCQVALEQEYTDALADELNYRKFDNGKSPMTTDLVAKRKNGSLVAYSVKAQHIDAEVERTRQKLEMERLYWERHNFEFHLVFKEDMNPILCSNIADVLAAYDDRFICDDIGKIRHLIAHKYISVDMNKPLDYAALVKRYKGELI